MNDSDSWSCEMTPWESGLWDYYMVSYSAWRVLVKRSMKILQKERIVNCRLTLRALVANCKFHSEALSKILIRPGKLELLFRISHFLDLHAAGGH